MGETYFFIIIIIIINVKLNVKDYKTLVVMRKSDGAMVTGEKVRDVLNIPKTKTVAKFMLDLVRS
jgi:hypothetical protein